MAWALDKTDLEHFHYHRKSYWQSSRVRQSSWQWGNLRQVTQQMASTSWGNWRIVYVCTYVHAYSLSHTCTHTCQITLQPSREAWPLGSSTISLVAYALGPQQHPDNSSLGTSVSRSCLCSQSALFRPLSHHLWFGRAWQLCPVLPCSKFPLPSCQWGLYQRSYLRKQDPVLFVSLLGSADCVSVSVYRHFWVLWLIWGGCLLNDDLMGGITLLVRHPSLGASKQKD